MPKRLPLFDAHFHIIDKRFPLLENNGYLPDEFTVENYRQRTQRHQHIGGALVSGSFQGFDQDYLIHALDTLGENYVGVTQLDTDTNEETIIKLHSHGIRAIRINVRRGSKKKIKAFERLVKMAYEVRGWHTEFYIDSREIEDNYAYLKTLPAISVDHLGLSKSGLPWLYRLVEIGTRVKASGFSRLNFPPSHAIKQIHSINPSALMFGTDLPSTRAPKPYQHSDYTLIQETLDENSAQKVFVDNAMHFYKLSP